MFHRSLLAAAIALTSVPAFAATYTLDPQHTQVQFTWNHFGFSNPAAVFGKIDATLDFDQTDPTKSKVSSASSVICEASVFFSHVANAGLRPLVEIAI